MPRLFQPRPSLIPAAAAKRRLGQAWPRLLRPRPCLSRDRPRLLRTAALNTAAANRRLPRSQPRLPRSRPRLLRPWPCLLSRCPHAPKPWPFAPSPRVACLRAGNHARCGLLRACLLIDDRFAAARAAAARAAAARTAAAAAGLHGVVQGGPLRVRHRPAAGPGAAQRGALGWRRLRAVRGYRPAADRVGRPAFPGRARAARAVHARCAGRLLGAAPWLPASAAGAAGARGRSGVLARACAGLCRPWLRDRVGAGGGGC